MDGAPGGIRTLNNNALDVAPLPVGLRVQVVEPQNLARPVQHCHERVSPAGLHSSVVSGLRSTGKAATFRTATDLP